MTFAHPTWLWWLAALPVLLLFEWRAARRADRALERLVGMRKDPVLLEQRLPGQRRVGIVLRTLALACLIVGAAGPEWGFELVRRSALGSEVVLIVDVSASMDVRDVAPSRLEEARREAIGVLERLQGSKVGVVAFAGEAVRLCPLTLDRSAARLVLESLSSTTVAEPGSDLGNGLRVAAKLLPPKRRGEQLIVVWTDGEDLEAHARGAIEELAQAGLRVLVVGVGTRAGDVVPVLDEQNRIVDVKRDDAGGPVRSRLDEALLQRLARRTRGAYFSAARPGGELPRLLAALGGVGRGERGERLVERPVERFMWLALAAAALLGFDRIRRRRRAASSEAVPTARTVAAASVALLALALTPGAEAQSAWARGDEAFRKARWAAAESLYALRAASRAPAEVRVNLNTARARAGKQDPSREGLTQELSAPGRAGQTAAYNLGTLQAETRNWDDALKNLRTALERTPNDEDARFNYEWVLRQKEEERRRQNSPQSPRPDPEPKPSQPRPGTPNPSQPPPPDPMPQQPLPPPQMGQGLDRRQAEQLLGSLQELERLEQQRMRRVRVLRDRRGKDW